MIFLIIIQQIDEFQKLPNFTRAFFLAILQKNNLKNALDNLVFLTNIWFV
jgi:hypothetical protein